MNQAERELARHAFENASTRKGSLTVIVATSAFGLGMDYAKVPAVCHLYPRPNVAEYWQQVGRAGRGMNWPAEWAEALAIVGPKDRAYALRFAKAPALDGLLNAYTMPLHGWMYAWKRGGHHMSLLGQGGRPTKFSKLVADLQNLGVIGRRGHAARTPKGTLRFRLNPKALRSDETRRDIEQLAANKYRTAKRLKKVFRYLRIAALSKRTCYVALEQELYKLDKAGTVLQRLNRWVDAGYLSLTEDGRHAREIRLNAERRTLSPKMIAKVKTTAERWKDHKETMVDDAMGVLTAIGPRRRRAAVLAHFGEAGGGAWRVPVKVPGWLR